MVRTMTLEVAGDSIKVHREPRKYPDFKLRLWVDYDGEQSEVGRSFSRFSNGDIKPRSRGDITKSTIESMVQEVLERYFESPESVTVLELSITETHKMVTEDVDDFYRRSFEAGYMPEDEYNRLTGDGQ